MKFGPLPVAQAVGAYLAHATEVGAERFRKGRRLSSDDATALAKAGVATIIVARLDEGDVGEDEAATRLANALAAPGMERKPASTGRVNIHAVHPGVFSVKRAAVDAINGLDPGVTLATLADHSRVDAGQMVATVKVIPFAVADGVIARAESLGAAVLALNAFRPHRVGLVQTRLASVRESVLDKTARVTAGRLARSNSVVSREIRCAHDETAVALALGALSDDSDMLIVFGASAVTDPDDVIPAAIRIAGGVVERVGMPVDPGNLLVLGDIAGKRVIGAPGCARSPKENGFDWVLDRLLAGLDVSSATIAGMGVGGLLMEIPMRPSPRERAEPAARPTIAAIVLAAGRSSRMGGPNKLLATFDAIPLVRRTVERVAAGSFDRVVVVTGHQAGAVEAALSGTGVALAHNPSYADGIASSLRAGLRAAGDADAVMIVLADMPSLATADFERLIAVWRAAPHAVVRAASGGKRGNPVVLPRTLFAGIERLEGDAGARNLLDSVSAEIVDVEIGPAAIIDVDTPDALASAGGQTID